MALKDDLRDQCDAKGIEYTSRTTVQELQDLLAASEPAAPSANTMDASTEDPKTVKATVAHSVDSVDAKANTTDLSGIDVGDPEALKPVTLPLVVSPKNGSWASKEQAEYAATLNAYAYANPKKWAIKKKTLLERLVEIGNNPDAYQKYAALSPASGNLVFNDKRFGQGNDNAASAA